MVLLVSKFPKTSKAVTWVQSVLVTFGAHLVVRKFCNEHVKKGILTQIVIFEEKQGNKNTKHVFFEVQELASMFCPYFEGQLALITL